MTFTNFVWHSGMSWRHLTPHKCPLIYLCGSPFDSSHFEAIEDAD